MQNEKRWDTTGLVPLTAKELESLPFGTVILSISGRRCVKGVDKISLDTRDGLTAFGIFKETEEKK